MPPEPPLGALPPNPTGGDLKWGHPKPRPQTPHDVLLIKLFVGSVPPIIKEVKTMDEYYYMSQALKLAETAKKAGEVPEKIILLKLYIFRDLI